MDANNVRPNARRITAGVQVTCSQSCSGATNKNPGDTANSLQVVTRYIPLLRHYINNDILRTCERTNLTFLPFRGQTICNMSRNFGLRNHNYISHSNVTHLFNWISVITSNHLAFRFETSRKCEEETAISFLTLTISDVKNSSVFHRNLNCADSQL